MTFSDCYVRNGVVNGIGAMVAQAVREYRPNDGLTAGQIQIARHVLADNYLADIERQLPASVLTRLLRQTSDNPSVLMDDAAILATVAEWPGDLPDVDTADYDWLVGAYYKSRHPEINQ